MEKYFRFLLVFVVILFLISACGTGGGSSSSEEDEKPYVESTEPNNSSNSSSSNSNNSNNDDPVPVIIRTKPSSDITTITIFVGEELPLEVTEIQEYSYSWTLETNGVPNIIATSADSVWIPDESDVGSHKIYCSVLDESFIEIYVDSIVDVTVKAKPIDPPPPPPPPISGCTDPTAKNYNSEAEVDDGSCEYPISGCTNPEAANYNPDAEIDCDCCVVYGCANPKATNYNPNATDNDGSCVFPPPPPQKGLADTCWPMFSHDIQRSGTTNCTGTTSSNILWQKTTNLHDYSCPAIDEEVGVIYLAESDGISSLNLVNGNQNWKFQSSNFSKFTGPSILKNGDIAVSAIKLSSTEQSGRFIRLSEKGNLKSDFDCLTFTASYNVEHPEEFRSCPPLILADESFVFGATNSNSLDGGYGFFDSQGKKIGEMNGNWGFNDFGNPAAIDDEFSEELPIFYWINHPEGWSGLSGQMAGCRPRTGSEEYYFTQKYYSADYTTVQPRTSMNKIIFGTSHEIFCYKYESPISTPLKWSTPKNTTNFIIYQDQVIASGETGISAYSLSDGSSLWSSPNVVDAIELVADNSNRIYALLKNQVACFSSTDGSILWSKDFSEPTEHGTLAIAPEKLIAIRSDCNQIVCFGN